MAIVIALLDFNDLGCSVTPTFLFRNRFYLQLSPQYPNMNKKSMWEVKKISSFLSSGRKILPSCNPSFNNSLYGVFLLQRVFQFMHADLAYKVLTESGLAQVLANFLRENYQPKLSNFGRSYFFTASLAQIDTHIRSYLNPSIMKVN